MLTLIGAMAIVSCQESPSGRDQVLGQDVHATAGDKDNDENSHDFGVVHLRDGRVRVAHEFRIINTTNARREVVKISRTCGCVECELSDEVLDPGETAVLTVSMDVMSSGPAAHGASLIYADDTIEHYTLRAHGVIDEEFRAILEFPEIDASTKSLPLRFYLIDSAGYGELETPEVVAPQGATLHCEGWIVLESRAALSLRPTRQVMNCTLDLSQYFGEFPVEVQFRSAGGRECTISVFSP